MAVLGTVTITHTGAVSTAQGGFKVGPFTQSIYLGDVLKRNGLGGGVSVYNQGQDQYLDYGTPITMVQTGELLLSIQKGQLSKLIALGLVTVA
jgi:hypothetical protein